MKQKFLITVLLIFLIFSLTGCAKCIDVKTETVEVVIINEYYNGPWTQFIWSGKTMIPINHPAQYEITVKYGDMEETFDDEITYKKYHNRIGETISATLETRIYENGYVHQRLVGLEG